MQSIMGVLLTAEYAAAAAAAIGSSPNASKVTASVQSELTKSFDGADAVAKQWTNRGQARARAVTMPAVYCQFEVDEPEDQT